MTSPLVELEMSFCGVQEGSFVLTITSSRFCAQSKCVYENRRLEFGQACLQ